APRDRRRPPPPPPAAGVARVRGRVLGRASSPPSSPAPSPLCATRRRHARDTPTTRPGGGARHAGICLTSERSGRRSGARRPPPERTVRPCIHTRLCTVRGLSCVGRGVVHREAHLSTVRQHRIVDDKDVVQYILWLSRPGTTRCSVDSVAANKAPGPVESGDAVRRSTPRSP